MYPTIKLRLLYRLTFMTLALVVVAGSSWWYTRPAEGVHKFMPNAVGSLHQNVWGSEADIEVANPQLRDCGYDHCFSMIRTYVQNLDGHNWFVEMGWIKGYPCGILAGPKVVKLKNDANSWGFTCFGTAINPGETHHFAVINASPTLPSTTTWDVWVDGTLVDAEDANFSTTTRIRCGGETSSEDNAMGVGACLNNKYRPYNSSNYWDRQPWYYDSTTVNPPYTLVDVTGQPYSWQVYGNN